MPRKYDDKVKGKKTESNKKRSIDDKKIDDADFEEIE